MLGVRAFVFHLYEEAPLAVRVAADPEQINALLGTIDIEGAVRTVICTVWLVRQKFELSITCMVYIPETIAIVGVGETITLDCPGIINVKDTGLPGGSVLALTILRETPQTPPVARVTWLVVI